MRDEIDELVEREVSLPGATRESVFIAVAQLDAQFSRRRSRPLAEKQQKSKLRDRASRILLYFRHGFAAGNATPEDLQLIGLIEALARSGSKSP